MEVSNMASKKTLKRREQRRKHKALSGVQVSPTYDWRDGSPIVVTFAPGLDRNRRKAAETVIKMYMSDNVTFIDWDSISFKNSVWLKLNELGTNGERVGFYWGHRFTNYDGTFFIPANHGFFSNGVWYDIVSWRVYYKTFGSFYDQFGPYMLRVYDGERSVVTDIINHIDFTYVRKS